IAKRDRAVVAATLHTRRAALLLSAVDPVWKLIVSDDVIELCRRLVVPGTPRLAAVHAYNRALIGREQHDVRVFRIDPKRVVIVAAGRTFERCERLAAVSRAISCDRGGVDDLLVAWIYVDLGKVTAARPGTSISADATPRFAGIIRAIDSAH